MDDLPGIENVRHEGGVSYKYRGIEEITSVLQPILVKHGVVITPLAELVSVVELPHKGTKGDWTRTTLSVGYTLHHAHSDESIFATCIGVGDDNADKGANKAMSQAFKYLLLQTFCISDPADDGDSIPADGGGVRGAENTEQDYVVPAGWGSAKESADAHSKLSDRVSKLTPDQIAECSALRKLSGGGWPLPKEAFDALDAYVALCEAGLDGAVVQEDKVQEDLF
jgi:hypothetical protein